MNEAEKYTEGITKTSEKSYTKDNSNTKVQTSQGHGNVKKATKGNDRLCRKKMINGKIKDKEDTTGTGKERNNFSRKQIQSLCMDLQSAGCHGPGSL